MKESYLSRLSNISEFLSIIIIILGTIFLIGWAFNVPIFKSPNPFFSTIKSNAALCFVFIGISIWLLQTKRINKSNIMIAKILAVIIIIIGLLTLIEHLTDFNFGIDQILFTELPGALNTSSPNRLAFITAINLVLIGSAILVLDKNINVGWPLFQILIIIEGLMVFLTALGYAYNASNLYIVYHYTGASIYSVLTTGLIFFAVIFIRPDKGFIGILLDKYPGSALGRKLLPVLIIIPIMLGWLTLLGQENGLYDSNQGYAILVFSTAIAITTLLWISIISINKSEKHLERHYNVSHGMNEILRGTIVFKSEKDVVLKCLEVAKKITSSNYGFLGEIIGGRLTDLALIHPEMESDEAHELVVGMEIAGYWGRTIKEERSQIVNDPDSEPDKRGVPEGHSPINSFLGVPLKQGDQIIGMIGLANKEGGYNIEDQEAVEALSFVFVEAIMSFRARNELKETVAELKSSNEELRSFAFITSHDLQEPLRTIASYAQLIKRRYKGQLDKDADEFIDFMVGGASRMKDMIQGLLDYSRVGTRGEEFKEFDAIKSLNNALLSLQSSIEENNAKITYDKLPNIVADENQISRVFQNLIGNAIKFKKHDEPPKIHISAEKRYNEYVFSVRDNSIGIEKEYIDQIFEVFKRLHTIDQYEGAGIGLAIVKRIIKRHNGHVWVESEYGKGSTFYFTIPEAHKSLK